MEKLLNKCEIKPIGLYGIVSEIEKSEVTNRAHIWFLTDKIIVWCYVDGVTFWNGINSHYIKQIISFIFFIL